MKSKIIFGLAVTLLISACGAPSEDDIGEPQAKQGRDETAPIRNTEHIGYAGDAIADKLDAALDLNDNRTADLDRQIDQSSQPQ